ELRRRDRPFDLLQDARVWSGEYEGVGTALCLIGPLAGEPVLGLGRGRSQVAVLSHAQDLPSGLAHKGCIAVDPDYPVVLGQFGDTEALLVGQRQCLHSVLLSCAPLSHPTLWRSLRASE